MTLTARANFFDGTPVPGIGLTAELFGERKLTTDRAGVATTTTRATTHGYAEGEDWASIAVQPARSEEGDISAYGSVLVFPAAVRLEGAGTVASGRATVSGSLHAVAIERLEAAWNTPAWDTVKWNGAPVAGTSVTAAITELVPVRVRTRQVYDFIAKKVVNQYDYRIDRVARGTRTVTTGPDGSFRLGVATTTDHDYEFVLTATDAQGRHDPADGVRERAVYGPGLLDADPASRGDVRTGGSFRSLRDRRPDLSRCARGSRRPALRRFQQLPVLHRPAWPSRCDCRYGPNLRGEVHGRRRPEPRRSSGSDSPVRQ